MVESAGLEIRCSRKVTVSSNLTPSARKDFANASCPPRFARRLICMGFLAKKKCLLSIRAKEFFNHFFEYKSRIHMWKNLAPNLIRQRVIIEGTTEKIVEPEQIRSYLSELAKITDMEVLSEPEAHSAHDMGYGGWIHWKSSGAAFYSYPTNPPLFTVDCYTCKPFSAEGAAECTRKYFNAIELVWQEVKV